MQKRFSFPMVALILVIGAGVFIGCSNSTLGDTGNKTVPIPEALKGTWVGIAYGDKYIISETAFTAEFAYAGTVVNVREDGPGAGYITIKYTENPYYTDILGINVIGNYYVVHYKNLTSSTVVLTGAYSAADPDYGGGTGKATQALAESTYTTENGYFGSGSDCTKST